MLTLLSFAKPAPITMPETSPRPALVATLPTGMLELYCKSGVDIATWCAIAARANPKRGFLIVSTVLGRHLPARPAAMRATMDVLAAMLPADLPEPVVVLGMAETATALGQGSFAAYLARHPGKNSIYLQSSRQRASGAQVIAQFEEGHSHATTHLVQVADPAVIAAVAAARSLVIIDDECSTGATFAAAAHALIPAMPLVERIATACITDWSDHAYLDALPRPATAHAIVSGSMRWVPGATEIHAELSVGSNNAGTAPMAGMTSRTGLVAPETVTHPALHVRTAERVLVLGEGEHSYAALLVAETIEAQGGIAAVQCITRSPALLGGAMASISSFTDTYGSGAPCFLYNMLAHQPDRVVIVSEVAGNQVVEARNALTQLGSAIPVDLLRCTYSTARTRL